MALASDGFAEVGALGVVVLLALAARWVFRPARPNRTIRRVDASDARELGLLIVIATRDRAQAQADQARLADAGIRASASLRSDGRFDLLVFAQDLDRARELLN